MAHNPYTVAAKAFGASARYTAAADVDILITNPTNSFAHSLRFLITTDDTVPAASSFVTAGEIRSGRDKALQLLTGERIWFAGDDVFDMSVID